MFYVIACKRGFDVKFSAVAVRGAVSVHRTSGAAIADMTRRNIAFDNRK